MPPDPRDCIGPDHHMAHHRDLTRGSIPAHFRALAVPAAIGMVFSTLYNVVDLWYGSPFRCS